MKLKKKRIDPIRKGKVGLFTWSDVIPSRLSSSFRSIKLRSKYRQSRSPSSVFFWGLSNCFRRVLQKAIDFSIYRKLFGFKPQYCGNIVVNEFCNMANRRKIFSFSGTRQPIAPSNVAKTQNHTNEISRTIPYASITPVYSRSFVWWLNDWHWREFGWLMLLDNQYESPICVVTIAHLAFLSVLVHEHR